jgi:hypothetical protein
MTLLDDLLTATAPSAAGELPGPRSAAVFVRRIRRDRNAGVYRRYLASVIDEAKGSFVRDVGGGAGAGAADSCGPQPAGMPAE